MYAYSYKLYPFIYSNFLFLILLIIRGVGGGGCIYVLQSMLSTSISVSLTSYGSTKLDLE